MLQLRLLHVLLVEMTSQLMSTVAKTTHPPPASPRTWLSWTSQRNGVYRPTVTMSTPPQLMLVSQTDTVTESQESAAESVGVWVAVGVGIAALVIVLAVAILVSFQSFCSVVEWSVLFHTMTTCSTSLPAQHLQPSDLFSCRPHSLELSPRFHPGPDIKCRLFQTFA